MSATAIMGSAPGWHGTCRPRADHQAPQGGRLHRLTWTVAPPELELRITGPSRDGRHTVFVVLERDDDASETRWALGPFQVTGPYREVQRLNNAAARQAWSETETPSRE